MMTDRQMEELHRACARIHELAVAMWLQRLRTFVESDDSTWRAALAAVGLDGAGAERYEQELQQAKASGEILPAPPVPKDFKRQPTEQKVLFAVRAIAESMIAAADPSGSRHRQRFAAPAPVSMPMPPTQAPSQQPIVIPTPREQRVYFIQGVEGGPIKIGVSLDPEERLSALQTASPIRLRIIGLVRGGHVVERAFHERLARHRVHGEWFADAPEVLAAIAEALQ